MRKRLSEASWKTTIAGVVALAAIIGAILEPAQADKFLALAGASSAAIGIFAKDH